MPQAQAQELEELNRELRQCNLQQFIQQTGAALPPAPQPDRAPQGTQVGGSGGWLAQQGPSQLQTDLLSPQDLMPPARERPLPGGPQSPALVSSLSPEGMCLCLTLGGTRSACGPSAPSACGLSTVAPMRQNSWR